MRRIYASSCIRRRAIRPNSFSPMPQGSGLRNFRHEKLSGDESYDAKENKGTPSLLTFTAVKGSVYHAAVEGYWTSDHSHEVVPVQSMEIIFPTNVSIHGDEECIELLPETEEFEEPQCT